MKRILSLLLVLLMLPLFSATAAPFEAPDSYQAEFKSKTGKSTVKVDAKVIVPDAETYSQIMLEQYRFTVKDAWDLAYAALPEGEWQRVFSGSEWVPYTGDPDKMELTQESSYGSIASGNSEERIELFFDPYEGEEKPFGFPDRHYSVTAFNWDRETLFGLRSVMRQLTFIKDSGYNAPYYTSAYLESVIPLKGDSTPGQPLTIQEARKLATEMVLKITSDFELFKEGIMEGYICYHKPNTQIYNNVLAKNKAYIFTYTRSIGGVPVTLSNGQMESYDEARDYQASEPPGYESIIVVVDGEEVVLINWYAPCTVGEVITADCVLLPFEQIMEVFAAVSPLSIASFEQYSNNKLIVEEIRLGYAPVRLKDAPNTWELQPVWDFIGTRYIYGNDTAGYGTYLSIDAVDGTVIDRRLGY